MPFTNATLLPAEVRRQLADDPLLGAGNVLRASVAANPRPDLPFVISERPVIDADGSRTRMFTLAEFDSLTQSWSTRYLSQGVQPRDRVAVYVTDGFEDIIQMFALCQIGAIPVLINGLMPADLAAGLCERTGAVGLYTDVEHAERILERLHDASLLRVLIINTEVEAVGHNRLADEDRYRHDNDDPVCLFHSSGTTGVPKAVIWTHRQSIEGVRHLLRSPFAGSGLDPAAPLRRQPPTRPESDGEGSREILLSAVPQSHSAGMSFVAGALLTGVPMIAMSNLSGAAVVEAIEWYRPTMVSAFASTYAEMSAAAPDPQKLGSVSTWFNTGDSAHGRHVEPLVKTGRRRVDGRWVSGSEFVDGLGSTELGFAQFLHILTADSLRSDRCVGTPHVFAEPAVLRPNGALAEPHEIGLLGVRSPTVTPGYWNDSDLTYRSVLGGYWLSGDLVYRDREGIFYHLDRVVDVVQTSTGPAYSLLMEEIILACQAEIVDCSVVGAPYGDAHVPVAVVTTLDEGARPEDLLRAVNAVLQSRGQPELAMLEVSGATDGVPLGPTGKVLKRELRARYSDVFASKRPLPVAGRAYARDGGRRTKAEA